jgi:hypothetical protein
MTRTFVCSVLAAALLALAGCGRQEPSTPAAPTPAPPPAAMPAPTAFSVSAIELGNQIGSDKRVTAASASFAPADTIYASIATEGEAKGVVLAARWSYEDGQTVAESRETVASAGPTVVEFHIVKPDGWPAGRYRVDVTANGAPAGAREFEVR